MHVENQSWLSDIFAARKDEIKYIVNDNLIESMPVRGWTRSGDTCWKHAIISVELVLCLSLKELTPSGTYLTCITSVCKRHASALPFPFGFFTPSDENRVGMKVFVVS